MNGEQSRRRVAWRDVGLRGVVLVPLAVGALCGVTQLLVLFCVLAFLLLPL
jgi:hypothetical protein